MSGELSVCNIDVFAHFPLHSIPSSITSLLFFFFFLVCPQLRNWWHIGRFWPHLFPHVGIGVLEEMRGRE